MVLESQLKAGAVMNVKVNQSMFMPVNYAPLQALCFAKLPAAVTTRHTNAGIMPHVLQANSQVWNVPYMLPRCNNCKLFADTLVS